MQKSAALIIGAFFTAGSLIIGLSIRSGLQYEPQYSYRTSLVSVSGSASKVVNASAISWSFDIVNSNNVLSVILEKSAKDKEALKEFFVNAGVPESDIVFDNLQVVDAKNTNAYDFQSGNRFIAEQGVIIQTSNINEFKNARNRLSELYKTGIMLKYQYKNDFQTKYFYDAKYEQQLIDEAFANAKAAAQKIAEQSNKKLGGTNDIYIESLNYDYASSDYSPSKQLSIRINVSFNLE
ncbi:MAG: SIMPL domain-containing protein [Campylobacteraceae bacterium]|jgi:hypothetical protein|nr:SIMPL domain-containing protein [Campylobacteraceae bacterium]